MNLLYHVGLSIYWLVILLASSFQEKARKRIKGSPDWLQQLKAIPPSKSRIWMHAASYGEFEQGKPVFEELRRRYPDHYLVLTFFSPSGYEAFKSSDAADLVLYLPFDFSRNAKRFLTYLKPQVALFVKYEFWLNYLKQAHVLEVPVVYFSSIFRPSQHFFKPSGKIFRNALRTVDHFFVQNEESIALLDSIGIKQVTRIGDTRVDRVLKVQAEQRSLEGISAFKGDNKLLVAGSTWLKDEQLLAEWIKNTSEKVKLIIAPHELDQRRLGEVNLLFPSAGAWSSGGFIQRNILVMDEMGLLKYLYAYADYSYVGGGFGKGVHNTLEALVWGSPVFFGPHCDRFEEAKDISRHDFGGVVRNSVELEQKIQDTLSNNERIKEGIAQYFMVRAGATEKIVNYLSGLISDE